MTIDRRTALAVLGAGLIQAPALAAQAGEPTMSKSNKDVALEFVRAIERGETDALADFMTPDFRQIEYPNAMSPKGQSRGVEGCIEGSRKGQAILQWQKYEIKSVVAEGDLVFVETAWVGKLSVALGPTLPLGYEMKADIAMVMQFRDGKLCLQRNYDCYQPLGS